MCTLDNMGCDIASCGSLCCRNCAVLTEIEMVELIENAKKEYSLELPPKKYFKKAKGEHGIYFAVKMVKGQCIFLNREKRCRVYKCRPVLCELYPVIDADSVDERCPIANKLPGEKLNVLKRRYADEVDERIKKENSFLFV